MSPAFSESSSDYFGSDEVSVLKELQIAFYMTDFMQEIRKLHSWNLNISYILEIVPYVT